MSSVPPEEVIEPGTRVVTADRIYPGALVYLRHAGDRVIVHRYAGDEGAPSPSPLYRVVPTGTPGEVRFVPVQQYPP